jgi:hypothetical protein
MFYWGIDESAPGTVMQNKKSETSAYPGEKMSPGQMLALAHEYKRIAQSLDKLEIKSRPIALAPFRFAAIHAIELYINAYLLFRGVEARELRKINHDLVRRQIWAHELGLVLRSKTIERIGQIMLNREYLSARYSVCHVKNGLDFTQLEMVMSELAKKVTMKICNGK